MKSDSQESLAPRDLSVVNDYKIRKEMFSASENLLKKIRKLEKEHADFLSWDQLLYQDWYNVTFRKELQEGELLNKRLRTLSTFQIHLNQIIQASKVTPQRAYFMLKDEEVQYQSGDEEWKFVIDSLRQQRFENATKNKMPQEQAVSADANPDIQTVNLNSEQVVSELNLADILHEDDSTLSGLRRCARAIYHYLNDIDDSMMGRHLADATGGYQLFKESFQIAMKCGNWKLLARIWKTGEVYQQRFLKPMPAHLKDFLQQIFSEYNCEEESENGSTENLTETEISLRSSYRKLARMLHPDVQEADVTLQFQEWSAKKWLKVQAAYKERDHEALKRLEIICMAEQGQLNHMTMDEIYQSSLVLADELASLKKSLSSCRKHPAWKFSSRRRYDALTKKLRKELQTRFAPVEEQVHTLEAFLQSLQGTSQANLH
ncbi:J domain-containing protein [Bdellovibrio sp. NC01]|uniref:J domain-containing protein n=1 Tax=Bdellovibrio sp. NC01 TaxID=2220073 RepID=UPI001158A464|nr:J domain-containing protein [Bdellovibrio sp. NC01]QDK39731.1 hypothetical protein DOE51_09765 [Bdellovibrio sp. NC01]